MKSCKIIKFEFLLIFTLFLACSNSVKDYDENGRLKAKMTSIGNELWEMEYYYPNGILKEKGRLKDSIRIGVWKEWYSDGLEKWQGTYKDGDRVIEVHQQEPVVVFSSDNEVLSVGKATGIKILVKGLHPEDAAYSISNGSMEKHVEDSASDIFIIPQKKGELKLKVYALHFSDDYFIGETILHVE